jgi:hypothetical protein
MKRRTLMSPLRSNINATANDAPPGRLALLWVNRKRRTTLPGAPRMKMAIGYLYERDFHCHEHCAIRYIWCLQNQVNRPTCSRSNHPFAVNVEFPPWLPITKRYVSTSPEKQRQVAYEREQDSKPEPSIEHCNLKAQVFEVFVNPAPVLEEKIQISLKNWKLRYTSDYRSKKLTGVGTKSSCRRSRVLSNNIMGNRMTNVHMIPTTTKGMRRECRPFPQTTLTKVWTAMAWWSFWWLREIQDRLVHTRQLRHMAVSPIEMMTPGSGRPYQHLRRTRFEIFLDLVPCNNCPPRLFLLWSIVNSSSPKMPLSDLLWTKRASADVSMLYHLGQTA